MSELSMEQVGEQLENIHVGPVEVRVKSMACIRRHDAALRARLVTLQSWVEERDATIALLQARLAKGEQQLAAIQATVGDTEFALRARVAELEQRNTELEGDFLIASEQRKAERQQLAASQARCREMEQVEKQREEAGWVSRSYMDEALALKDKHFAQLQATLGAREAEVESLKVLAWDKRQEALKERDALLLTWTTARPTVAGRYWYKDLDGTHILMIERVHHTDLFVSYEGSLTPLNEYHGEFAGPIPLPTEGQQARGSSGGAANHGAGA